MPLLIQPLSLPAEDGRRRRPPAGPALRMKRNSSRDPHQHASSRPSRPGDRAPTNATEDPTRCGLHRRGGSARAGPTGPRRAAARPTGDSPGDHGVGVRIDDQLGVVGAPSNTHREPAASIAAATWLAKPRASSSPRASRSRWRAPSRTESARARVVLPLPAPPITTIRLGIGAAGAGRAAISAR